MDRPHSATDEGNDRTHIHLPRAHPQRDTTSRGDTHPEDGSYCQRPGLLIAGRRQGAVLH